MTLDHVRVLDMHAALQLLKSRGLAIDQRDDLPIKHERMLDLRRELFESDNYFRKLLRFVLAIPSNEFDIIRGGVGDDANAIVLWLESPTLARDLAADAGVHRLQRSREVLRWLLNIPRGATFRLRAGRTR